MPDDRTSDPSEALQDADFLQREGFDVLSAYRMIRDPALRQKVRELVIAIAEAQPESD